MTMPHGRHRSCANVMPVTLRLGTAKRHLGVAIGTPEQCRGVALRLPLMPRRIARQRLSPQVRPRRPRD